MFNELNNFCGRRVFIYPSAVIVLLLVCVLYGAPNSLAGEGAAVIRGRTVVIDDSLSSAAIGRSLDYCEDRHSAFTIKDVSSQAFTSRFRPSRVAVPNFGLTGSAYWFRFTAANGLREPVPFNLMISYPLLDDVRLYAPDGRGGFEEQKSGDLIPFNERQFKHVNFVFPLVLKPGAATYYLRIQTVSSLSVPISVLSRDELYRKTLVRNWIDGMYYGILGIMLLYNLLVFVSTRGRDNLFYALYIAGFILASLAVTGYGAQFLWPGITFFSMNTLYNFLFNILYILFTREFLNTRSISPVLDRLALANIALGAAGLLVNAAVGNSLLITYFSVIVTAFTIILTFWISGVALRMKQRQANFYVASLSIIIIGVIVYILRAVAVLPVNIVTMQFMRYAMLVQILILSFGLTDKINVMKKKLEILNTNIVREMADHIRDKEALKRSEERFRGVIERNFDVIFIMDLDGRITYMSPSITAMSGYRVDELVGSYFKNYIEEEMMGLSILVFGDLLKGKEIIGFESTVRKKDGTRLSVEINLSPIMKGQTVTGIQGIARDISERKMAEEALLEEKERLAITLGSIGEGVIATDIKWRIHLMNMAAEDLTGWRQDEVLGRIISDVLVLMDQKTGKIKNVMDAGEFHTAADGFRSSTVLIRRDKTERIVSERIAPISDRSRKTIGHVIVVRDITEEVKFHGELLKIEKLESIGILAGGIAHDFNNILTAIMGNINLAKLTAGNNARLIDILDDAEKASVRAQELTHQFLTFAKGGAPVRRIASIEEIIRDSSRFILRGSNVRCTFKFQDGLWPVNVDVGQFSQVIQNLVINADQAMPEGGDLTISTENVILPPESGVPIKPGRYVKIMVSDTGVGIPVENQPKIFDPYFTTKGSGNGLGLTSTYSIIKRHEGYIFVDSMIGTGTAFYIYLPSSDTSEVIEKQNAGSISMGTGRILFMDDDEAINATARKILKHLGYSVDIVLDGTNAVNLYEKSLAQGMPYDLVILDLTIPGGMGGKKTIEKLRALNSGIKAIVSSGYSNDQIMANYRDYGFSGVIAKPYRIDELARVIKQVLGEKQ